MMVVGMLNELDGALWQDRGAGGRLVHTEVGDGRLIFLVGCRLFEIGICDQVDEVVGPFTTICE